MNPAERANLTQAIECATRITVAAVTNETPSTSYSESGKQAAEYFEEVFKKITQLMKE